MRKNIIMMILSMTLVLNSCDKNLLTQDPTDQISSGTFWKSQSDADMALTGVYAPLRLDVISAGGGGGTAAHWEGLTDNGYCSYSWEGGFQTLATTITPSSGNVLSSLYTSAYQGIAYANDFLANVGKIKDAAFTDETKNKYIGEAKFIRVYWYYWLTQVYSDVPYTDVPLTVETMYMPVTKKADIVAKLITDLDDCISKLPDITYVASGGHVVKGSAQALKARIQLFNGDFSGAASTAKAVIDGGKFSLKTDGETPYGDLFCGDLNQASFPEIMFSTRFDGATWGHRMEMQLNSWVSVCPTPEFAKNYQSGDSRKSQTIAYLGEPQEGNNNNPVTVNQGGSRQGMVVNKYSYAKKLFTSADDNKEPTHIIHIRYAEVLLTYAEAQSQANNGPDGSAYNAINIVRHRALLPDLTTGLTKAQFLDSVLRERRYEFFCEEAIRYMDLKRYKLAGTILPTIPSPPILANTDGTIPAATPSTTYMKWDDKWYVWPIPQSEVDKDPTNLKQVNTDHGY
jgi:starch-binding outer membrane protein, SusD/RagB family